MKKNFIYALMSAIVLSGAVSLTSCSSNEEVVENNPTFDGNGVKTDFAFNISKASQATTRMSGTNTQQDGGNFLGMSNMYLFPFDGIPGTVTETNNPYYYLGDLTAISDVQSSKVYSLTLPVGTDNFLFYGTATKTGTNFEQGILNSSISSYNTEPATKKQISDITFSLTPISSTLTDADKIANYLTAIAKTPNWKETVNQANTDGRYTGLSLLYQKFISDIAARAGSAEAVERLILDLFKSARAINQESTVTEIKTIAGEICNKIDAEVDEVRVTVSASATNPDAWTAAIKGVNGTFPANLDLPMGSAQYSWNTSDEKFIYNDNPSYAVGNLSASAAISKYCYPSELVYFDNSPLRATSIYKSVSNYPVTTSAWDSWPAATVGEGWTDTEVKSTTRAVAMTNNVNYGVALLETTVQLASTSLTDNMAEIVGGAAENQTITASTSRNDAAKESVFKVTGILIGGQPGQVGWNMISSSSEFSYVIYDNAVTFKDVALSTSPTASNYTLVLDNYSQAKRDASERQSDVLIALQLVNEGADFYGLNGMIPAGNTFYLVGNLNLEGKSLTKATRQPTYRVTNENITRVFVQDYKTVANITIKADALKRAYSAIPDLRSTEVLFGLSVDLKWEPGITFTVEM